MTNHPIFVIYDGECDLCLASVTWLSKKLQFTALPFQTTPLEEYGLTPEQCSKSVFALSNNKTYSGASAVSFLLHQRGNRALALTIKASGPLGKWIYRWVAGHRHTRIVRLLTKLLSWANTH